MQKGEGCPDSQLPVFPRAAGLAAFAVSAGPCPAGGRRVRSLRKGVQRALSLWGQGGLRSPVPVPAEGSCRRSRLRGPGQHSSRAASRLQPGAAGSAESDGTQPFFRCCSWRDEHLPLRSSCLLSRALGGAQSGLDPCGALLVLGDPVQIQLALASCPLPGDRTVPVGEQRGLSEAQPRLSGLPTTTRGHTCAEAAVRVDPRVLWQGIAGQPPAGSS